MSESDVCLTCARIGWQKWLKECDGVKIDRNIVLKAKVLMQELYDDDPTIFSSHPVKTIKAGLIYFICVCEGYRIEGHRITQRDIAKIFGCSTAGLRIIGEKITKKYLEIWRNRGNIAIEE